jgi:hypothetical protein
MPTPEQLSDAELSEELNRKAPGAVHVFCGPTPLHDERTGLTCLLREAARRLSERGVAIPVSIVNDLDSGHLRIWRTMGKFWYSYGGEIEHGKFDTWTQAALAAYRGQTKGGAE